MQDFYTLLKLSGSVLLIIIILIFTYYGSRWYARRMQGGGGSRFIKLIDKVVLGQRNFLAIIQIGGKYYLIGVGDRGTELLTELPDLEEALGSMANQQNSAIPPAFQDLFEKAKERLRKKDDDSGAK